LAIVDDPADQSTLPRRNFDLWQSLIDLKNQIRRRLTLTVSLVTSFWLTAFTSHLEVGDRKYRFRIRMHQLPHLFP
jgi:hypothetical protein